MYKSGPTRLTHSCSPFQQADRDGIPCSCCRCICGGSNCQAGEAGKSTFPCPEIGFQLAILVLHEQL